MIHNHLIHSLVEENIAAGQVLEDSIGASERECYLGSCESDHVKLNRLKDGRLQCPKCANIYSDGLKVSLTIQEIEQLDPVRMKEWIQPNLKTYLESHDFTHFKTIDAWIRTPKGKAPTEQDVYETIILRNPDTTGSTRYVDDIVKTKYPENRGYDAALIKEMVAKGDLNEEGRGFYSIPDANRKVAEQRMKPFYHLHVKEPGNYNSPFVDFWNPPKNFEEAKERAQKLKKENPKNSYYVTEYPARESKFEA